MKKKPISNPHKRVIIQDWIKLRPYHTPSKYDMYYLQVANSVRDILADYQENLPLANLNEEEITLLACIITSYFEDFTNEIGMWQAFTQTNQKTIGKYLPFYDLSDYETDYLNTQDIEYLIWHFSSRIFDETIFSPDHLNDCATEILEVLEDNLDEAPVNVFYENFLQVSKNEKFADFKSKLHWVALKSYMIGIDLLPEFDIKLAEMLEDAKLAKLGEIRPEQALYLITEDYLFVKRSGFNTLNAPEMLALIIRANDQKREEIRRLQYRHIGYFTLEKSDKQYFYFKHITTEQVYPTLRDTFQNQKMIGNQPNMLFTMSLVSWEGTWSMTGLTSVSSFNSASEIEKIKKNNQQLNPWMLSKENLLSLREIQQKMHQSFIDFFQTPLPLFASGEEMNQQQKAFIDYHNKSISPSSEAEIAKRRKELDLENPIEDFKPVGLFEEGSDFGMFFLENEGLSFLEGIDKTIKKLQNPALTQDETGGLFFELVYNYDPEVINYILTNYQHFEIYLPVETDIDVEANLSYYQRFYQPDNFNMEYPKNISVN